MRVWVAIAGGAVGFALVLILHALYGPAALALALAGMASAGSIWQWWSVPELGPSARLAAGALHAVGFALLWAAGAAEAGLPAGFKPGLVLGCLVAGAILARVGRSRPAWSRACAAAGATLCAWLIAAFSGSQGAPGSYPSWLELLLGLDPASAEALSTLSRKVVHFLFYGTFALLTLRALPGRLSPRTVGIALLSVALYSCADETRQTATQVRSGSGWDVLLDLGGASAFATLSAVWRRGDNG